MPIDVVTNGFADFTPGQRATIIRAVENQFGRKEVPTGAEDEEGNPITEPESDERMLNRFLIAHIRNIVATDDRNIEYDKGQAAAKAKTEGGMDVSV